MAKRRRNQPKPAEPIEQVAPPTPPVQASDAAVQGPGATPPTVKRAIPIQPKMLPPQPAPREHAVLPPEHLREVVSPTCWLTDHDADRQMLKRLGIDPDAYPREWFAALRAWS